MCTSYGKPSHACSKSPGFVAPLDAITGFVAPLDAITARAQQSGDTVTFDAGSDPAAAAAATRAADVAVMFGH